MSPSHQFAELCNEVEREHPQEARWLRKLNATAQDGLLRYLATTFDQGRTAAAPELWRVCKNDRELGCVLITVPTGLDLRLMEGDDFRRTQPCKNASEARTLSEKWRTDPGEVVWSGS